MESSKCWTDPKLDRSIGGDMSKCSFDRLIQFANKKLDLDGQLEVFDHLDQCDICRDAIYQLSRDRDEAFFIHRANRMKPSVLDQPMGAVVGPQGAQG
jgi:hypothetical protein